MVVPQLSQMYLDNCGDVLSYYRHLVDVDPWLWMRHGWIQKQLTGLIRPMPSAPLIADRGDPLSGALAIIAATNL